MGINGDMRDSLCSRKRELKKRECVQRIQKRLLAVSLILQVLTATIFLLAGKAPAEEAPTLVTFYSPPGGGWVHNIVGQGSEKAWYASKLFDGNQRLITQRAIFHDRFLTLKMKPGEHVFAGDEPWRFNPSKYKSILIFPNLENTILLD